MFADDSIMLPSTTVQLSRIKIQKGAEGTIVLQLSRQIRELILSGKLAIGTRLPSTRVLSKELRVSRTTIRDSYEQLVAESYLNSSVGKGTFVIDNPVVLATSRESHFLRGRIEHSDTRQLRDQPPLSKRGKQYLNGSNNYASPLLVPFNPALPDFRLFPFSKWTRILKKTLINSHSAAMNYGDASGYPPLKQAIAENLRLTRGLNCEPDQVIIVASSEQAIHRIVTLVLNREESVWFGEPGIVSRRNAFVSQGIKTLTVPIDDEGVVVERAYELKGKVKLAYVLPSRHYPFGNLMSLSRRLELLNWASSRNAWILEDDYCCEFNQSGQAPPPIQTLDHDQRVIYMGGFSTTLFPSLRLAYIVVPGSLIEAASKMAQAESSVATVHQPALAEFISQGHYMSHVRKMGKTYQKRESLLAEFLQKHIGDTATISSNGGGLNFILNLPSEIHAGKLSEKLREKGIIAHPLSDYYLHKKSNQSPHLNGLAMGFACASTFDLEKSASLLVEEIKRYDTVR
ncbi:MAG: GntR family transcriptional regulator/MocR family aminotransferase [Gammaproteobacteria bacterium]|jgi:GntR family transcriptional regulator/MocR family aminotransferase